MSLVSEMLKNLQDEADSRLDRFGDRKAHIQPEAKNDLHDNERVLIDPIHKRKKSRSSVLYSGLFFGLALWTWDCPKQAEAVAVATATVAKNLYVFLRSIDSPSSAHTKNVTAAEVNTAIDEIPSVSTLLTNTTGIYPEKLARIGTKSEVTKRVVVVSDNREAKAMAETVKAIAANLISNTRAWEEQKEREVSLIAKPFLAVKLKNAPEFYSVDDVEIESAPGHTRLRIMVNGEIDQSIEKTIDGRYMNVLLPRTKLKHALPLVANGKAPIVGLQASSRLGDLILTLELLDKTATQSSVISHPDGTELVLDFMNLHAEAETVSSKPIVARQDLPALPPIQGTEILARVSPVVPLPIADAAPAIVAAPVIGAETSRTLPVDTLSANRMSILPHRATNQGVDENLSLAVRALERGSFEEARLLLQENIREYPRHAKSIGTLSDLLVEEGDKASAVKLLQEALTRMPHHTFLLKKMAEIYRRDGKASEALVLLQKSEPRFIDDPDYHAMMAALYQQLGQSSVAKDIYEKLVQYRPDEGLWWLGLGVAQETQGDKNSALKSYKEARVKANMDSKLLDFISGKVNQLSKG